MTRDVPAAADLLIEVLNRPDAVFQTEIDTERLPALLAGMTYIATVAVRGAWLDDKPAAVAWLREVAVTQAAEEALS